MEGKRKDKECLCLLVMAEKLPYELVKTLSFGAGKLLQFIFSEFEWDVTTF